MHQEVATARVRVVGDDHAGGRAGAALEGLNHLLRLRAGRRAHVEHRVLRLDGEHERRDHRNLFLARERAQLALALQEVVELDQRGFAALGLGAAQRRVRHALAAQLVARDVEPPRHLSRVPRDRFDRLPAGREDLRDVVAHHVVAQRDDGRVVGRARQPERRGQRLPHRALELIPLVFVDDLLLLREGSGRARGGKQGARAGRLRQGGGGIREHRQMPPARRPRTRDARCAAERAPCSSSPIGRSSSRAGLSTDRRGLARRRARRRRRRRAHLTASRALACAWPHCHGSCHGCAFGARADGCVTRGRATRAPSASFQSIQEGGSGA